MFYNTNIYAIRAVNNLSSISTTPVIMKYLCQYLSGEIKEYEWSYRPVLILHYNFFR